MGIMVYSLLWVMQDFVHQQYEGAWNLLVAEFISTTVDGQNPALPIIRNIT